MGGVWARASTSPQRTVNQQPTVCDIVAGSAGSIFNISKYRDTCESSIPIFSCIAILRYFGIERPLFDTFDTFDTYDTFDTFDTFNISILDIESIRQRRCEAEGATSLLMMTLFTVQRFAA